MTGNVIMVKHMAAQFRLARVKRVTKDGKVTAFALNDGMTIRVKDGFWQVFTLGKIDAERLWADRHAETWKTVADAQTACRPYRTDLGPTDNACEV